MNTLVIENSPTTRVSVSVHDDDGYSSARAVDLTTQVCEGTDRRWLEPRTTRVFLDPAEIRTLGRFLQEVAGGV